MCQALDSLRLDVEAVFDKHRKLLLRPAGTLPQLHSCPTVGSPDEEPRFIPVFIPDGTQSGAAQAETDRHLRPSVARASKRASQRASQRVIHRASVASLSSVGRLMRERRDFLKDEETDTDANWMRSMVEESAKAPPRRASVALTRGASMALTRGANRWPSLRPEDFIPRLVRRSDFELARAMMMIVDAVLVVWEMQDAAHRATHSSHSAQDGISDTLFFTVLLDISCGLFVADLCLRIAAGRYDPSYSAGNGWQTFQAVVVLAQLFQAVGQHSHRHQRSHSPVRVVLAMLSTLRLARILSLVMVTDVIRQHRSFRELRIMVLSLTGAVKSMVWSSLLVFMILLIFGTVLSEGAIAFLMRNQPPAAGTLDEQLAPLWERFGSLFDTVLTLFQVISGGVDWEVIWQNMSILGWGFRGLLLLYIGFSLIALLNVLTAVMIESTQIRCKADRGLAVQSELMEKRDYLATLKRVFDEIDEAKEGEVSQDQFRSRMKDPEIGAYFSQQGVDSDQISKLFNLFDSNKSGTLNSEEFMLGCLKVRGEAKRVDVAVLHRELTWIHDELEVLAKRLTHKPSSVLSSVSSVRVSESSDLPARSEAGGSRGELLVTDW
jgi:hypothetical protein